MVDRARELSPAIDDFLRQPVEELTPAPEAWQWLHRIVTTP
jgi:flagellum-specific ATP synthase